LWNKRSDEGYPQRPPVQPETPRTFAQPAPGAAPVPVQVPRPEPPVRSTATIGASMTIKGEIRSHEELLVEGEVEGTLESHSLLTVGPKGKVKANIKAREVVIYGSVRGNVEATEKIAIREQGNLVGDIKAAGISIDDGSYFKGSIDIVRPEPKVTAKPTRSDAPRVEAGVG
jgi:cytoskeletal protein CcmA (bactofilin family)